MLENCLSSHIKKEIKTSMLLSCMAMQIIHIVQGNVVITRMVQVKDVF
jgi:hypothetical protein